MQKKKKFGRGSDEMRKVSRAVCQQACSEVVS